MPEEIVNAPQVQNIQQASNTATYVNDVGVGVSRQIFQQQQEKEEIKMTELDTTHLSAQHGAIRHDIAVESARLGAQLGSESCGINKHIGDARQEDAENFAHTRREQAIGFGETRQIVMQEGQEGVIATKDARHDINNRVTNSGDRLADRVMELRGLVGERFYTVGRDLADLRQGQATLAKDIELNALKTQIEGHKNTQFLSDKIADDGEKTRGLINDLKYHDLNRSLVERNTELVECESDRRHWRHWAGQSQYASQFAQLQSQVQAFQSQLQETRQGLVNFGTMAGNAGTQSSTSNNVK